MRISAPEHANFLLLVIMGTAVDGRAPAEWAGLIIALTVTADIFAFGPVTNVALNPFRALAPAVLNEESRALSTI